MTKKWLVSLLGAAAMALSGAAFAQAPAVPALYIGAEVGKGDAGREDGLGWKFLGGYQFHRNFAAEVAYGWLVDEDDVEVTRARRGRHVPARQSFFYRQARFRELGV